MNKAEAEEILKNREMAFSYPSRHLHMISFIAISCASFFVLPPVLLLIVAIVDTQPELREVVICVVGVFVTCCASAAGFKWAISVRPRLSDVFALRLNGIEYRTTDRGNETIEWDRIHSCAMNTLRDELHLLCAEGSRLLRIDTALVEFRTAAELIAAMSGTQCPVQVRQIEDHQRRLHELGPWRCVLLYGALGSGLSFWLLFSFLFSIVARFIDGETRFLDILLFPVVLPLSLVGGVFFGLVMWQIVAKDGKTDGGTTPPDCGP